MEMTIRSCVYGGPLYFALAVKTTNAPHNKPAEEISVVSTRCGSA
jgi:uncharacterized Fe-S cluster protein YjdI